MWNPAAASICSLDRVAVACRVAQPVARINTTNAAYLIPPILSRILAMCAWLLCPFLGVLTPCRRGVAELPPQLLAVRPARRRGAVAAARPRRVARVRALASVGR